jgi:iron complex transport system substrate-binding protein
MSRSPGSRRFRLTVSTAAGAAVCALALSACGSGSDDSSVDAGSGSGSGAHSVTDATGTAVKVPDAPSRVVALSERDLDDSLSLGVKPVGLTAGRGQKGAPAYLTAKAKRIPVVGAVTGPDLEKVTEARPDVILAGQVSDKQVLAQLRKIAPTVVTYSGSSSWKSALRLTGRALGRTSAAQTRLADYQRKMTGLRKAVGGQAGSTVSVVRYAANGTSVMQQGVFISDVLKDAGFRRPAEQAKQGAGHSTPVSSESLGGIDADWLFVGTLGSNDSGLLSTLRKNPAWASLGAVEKNRAFAVDGSSWTSLGGPLAADAVLDTVQRDLTGAAAGSAK